MENEEWHGGKMYLRSERGLNLTIRPDGEVLGIDDDSRDCRLEVSSGGGVSLVRIRRVEEPQLYLCFKPTGELYGEADPNNEGTVFEENFQGSYTGFRSKAYPDWFVGIKKSGKAKLGPKTAWGQKAVKFLPRRRDFS